jgi:hypothetical protein
LPAVEHRREVVIRRTEFELRSEGAETLEASSRWRTSMSLSKSSAAAGQGEANQTARLQWLQSKSNWAIVS